ncbi:2-hydroxyacyl-CoA dehydratase family protein [bacterium]|nr:2-hydroxyacyl-CoA dehydratase family protein [bacterium]
MTSSYLEPIVLALNRNQKQLNSLASSGNKIIGYFCTYTPVEVIDACGFIPVRITGGAGDVEKAYSLIPDFVCPFMKRSLEKALLGEYAFLSGVIQGYTCDIACGVTNIWENNIKGDLYHTLPLPYIDSPESRKYFRSNIKTMIVKLNEASGHFSEEALWDSIKVYSRIRELVEELYVKRKKGKSPLNSQDLWYINQAVATIPPRDCLVLLEELLTGIKNIEGIQADGIPILISGSLIEAPDVFKSLEECGGKVVEDDLCTGIRAFSPASGEGKDPIDQIMDRHFKRFPCPSRAKAEDRFEHIKGLIAESGARGVIFLPQKFCAPHLSDIPFLSERLKEENIPTIVIEMDETWQTEGQFKTRLEGFFEMLR